MGSLSIIFTLLGAKAEDQLRCLPRLAADSGSKDFSFDRENPVVKLGRIINDLHFQREGESLEMWQNRLGIIKECEAGKIEDLHQTLEGLHVIFHLMTRSSVESLHTKHGINKAATWRLIRKLANDGKQMLNDCEKKSPDAIREFIENYKFDE